MTLIQRIKRFIDTEQLLSPGARVIVGFSGGADSTALLAILTRLGYECIAVHCHFGLRGEEADRDLEFSRQMALKLNCKFDCVKFDTQRYMSENSLSVEMACRELRYDYFRRIMTQTEAEAIVVGHHREDNIETFFLNLLRGSGIHGLRGMLAKRDNIIRPLLITPKAELLEYLESESLDYIVDSSNLCNDFKRNKLRNKILPLLEQEFPGSIDAICRSIGLLKQNEELYNSLIPSRQKTITGQSPTLLHEWFAPFGFNSDQCSKMSVAMSGATFTSPTHTLTICKGGGYSLRSNNQRQQQRPKLVGREIPFSNFWPRRGVLYLDADSLPENAEWELRKRRQGDRMRPFGMTGSRLVSDILADARVPANERDDAYVLTCNGEIVWVVGVRTSALYVITENTKRIFEIYHETL